VSEIPQALLRALTSLLHPRMLLLMLCPVLVAPFGLIPLLGFLTPVYGGLAFIHYCLAGLGRLREEPVATQ